MRTESFVAPAGFCVVKCAEVASHILSVGFADIAKLLGITANMNIIHDLVVLGLINRLTQLDALLVPWHLKPLA
jgi:hypothetical protein